MNFFGMKKKINAEQLKVVNELKQLLFPDYKKVLMNDNKTIMQIDSSVDNNLEVVLFDLREDYNDKAAQDTIEKIVERLKNARKLLQAYYKLESDYLIFEID